MPVQGAGANSSVELADAAVAAPLEAAWESIRTGLRRDLGARTFDGWLKPAELGAFEPDGGTLELWRDVARTAECIRRLSTKDADRWPQFCRRLSTLAMSCLSPAATWGLR